jgi:hypothetical protein
MDISLKTRQLYPDEQRLLRILKNKVDKESNGKIKYYHFLIAGLLGIGFTYLATIAKVGFLTFIFGTVAVFACAFLVFMPYEIYKAKIKRKAFLNELNAIINNGTVDTYVVKARRIASAKEFEDEGDLFIIEYNTDRVLYLWDYDYNLRKKFPCLDFEIYEEKFIKLLGRQVYPLSEPVKPLIIDKKAKWNYIKTVGAPGHLQTQSVNFDKLIEDFNNYA